MFLHIVAFTIFSKRLTGCLSSSASLGGSVAKARAANVSIIRFTQSICTAVSGGSVNTIAPENTMKSATRLTVI
jgi:hypothetical protein